MYITQSYYAKLGNRTKYFTKLSGAAPLQLGYTLLTALFPSILPMAEIKSREGITRYRPRYEATESEAEAKRIPSQLFPKCRCEEEATRDEKCPKAHNYN